MLYPVSLLPNHAGPEAKGSNLTTGLTLLWARSPFRRNFKHWQVSRKETNIISLLNPRDSYTGLFISPSGISELDCTTIKTDTAERSISIGRESLQVFFVLRALAYFQVPPLRGSREEKWRSH